MDTEIYNATKLHAASCNDEFMFNKALNKKYQALNIVISTGQSKEVLDRNVTHKDLDGMSADEIEAYYKIYELNYANKMSDYLNGTLISLYSYAVNKVLPIDDIVKLQEDLNSSYILNSELRNITSSLARVGGKIWSLVELSLTTFKHVTFGHPPKASMVEATESSENKEQCNEL